MRRFAAPSWVPWSSLWRGALLVLAIVFALSTQLLFQFDLYANWSLHDIFLGWLDHLADQLIVGASIFAVVALAGLLPVQAPAVRHGVVLVAIALGAVAGEALLLVRLPLPEGVSAAGVIFAKGARWMAIGALAYAFFVFRRQAAEAEALAHDSDIQRVQIDLQEAQARLQSLHAYIEPHFLFNTLANVRELYRTEPGRGRAMLRNFIAYVRAVLPQMRREPTTLRQDVDLARAYLGVLQVRMGPRLDIRFDVPEPVAALPFPALALSTLTENAIKHGLNPVPEGGAIEITARVDGGRLTVRVADTGAGWRGESGTGGGLANLRARLAALYGSAASLKLEANVPRGIRATITVPVETPMVEAA
jgi:signal transduction histidine kinase